MATKIDNEFMHAVATEEAWKKLSGEFKWTEALLEKYQNDVDWDEIVGNGHIQWTVSMLQKFCKRINWTKLSEKICDEYITPVFLDAFKDKWDWKILSENWGVEFTDELLTRYADLWDWANIIEHRFHNSIYNERGMDFYEKYKEYIPAAKLQGSNLWDEIVDQRKNQLIQEIVS